MHIYIKMLFVIAQLKEKGNEDAVCIPTKKMGGRLQMHQSMFIEPISNIVPSLGPLFYLQVCCKRL